METKIWQKHYDKGVSYSLEPYPDRTLLDVVSEAAKQRPEQPALWFKGGQMSYGELNHLSDALAAALVAQAVQEGDRVAIILPNCPQFVVTELAVWKAGAIVVPINPLYTER